MSCCGFFDALSRESLCQFQTFQSVERDGKKRHYSLFFDFPKSKQLKTLQQDAYAFCLYCVCDIPSCYTFTQWLQTVLSATRFKRLYFIGESRCYDQRRGKPVLGHLWTLRAGGAIAPYLELSVTTQLVVVTQHGTLGPPKVMDKRSI